MWLAYKARVEGSFPMDPHIDSELQGVCEGLLHLVRLAGKAVDASTKPKKHELFAIFMSNDHMHLLHNHILHYITGVESRLNADAVDIVTMQLARASRPRS